MTDRIKGMVLGAALGDSLGLPYENLSPARSKNRLKRKGLCQSFLFGKGLVSDDTELAAFALYAYASQPDKVKAHRLYARIQARWLLTLPAGIGRATLRSCLKLLFGVSPESAGTNSAGNGACARALFLGPFLDDELITENIKITHTDPRAIEGALLIARLTRPEFQNLSLPDLAKAILNQIQGNELKSRLQDVFQNLESDQDTNRLLAQWKIKGGPSGYVNLTVPLTVHLWLKNRQDFEEAMCEVISLGGDTDSLAFLVGGLIGLGTGVAKLPRRPINDLIDRPLSPSYLSKLGESAAKNQPPPKPAWTHYLWRGPLFFVTVITHVLLRLVRLT